MLVFPFCLIQRLTGRPYSTDTPIATVHAAGADDVNHAVQAAKAALVHPSWKLLAATERGQMLAKLADLIEKNKELFATIDAWDNGMFVNVKHACLHVHA